MTHPAISAPRAGSGTHLVGLYGTEAFLAAMVRDFLRPALSGGGAAVTVARRPTVRPSRPR